MATAENKVANTKHTLGPLARHETKDCWEIRDKSTDNCDVVAVVPKTGDEEYDATAVAANAMVFTATPELLDACCTLVSIVEQLIPEESVRGVADVVLAQGRYAIAKATGEDAPPA